MKRGQILRLANFTGGEASVFPVTNMPSKYSIKLQNCHISERGGIAKIPGYEKVNTTQVANLTNGFEFRKTDGTKIILAAGGGNIYKLVTGELVAKKTGLNASARVRFSAFNDICLATNGVDAPLKSSDGDTWAVLGGAPPATTFKTHIHKGRVWFIENANKLLASHSALNNPEVQEGYIDFKYVLKEGDELVDMFTYIDLQVFLFKNHIVIYSGQTPSGTSADYKLVQLISNMGVAATDVIQDFGSDAGFLHISGVKTLKQVVTTGSLNIGNASQLIDPTLRAGIPTASKFASAHYPKLGWFFILIGETVWIYSYTWKAWARIYGADVNGMFNTADGELYFCGNGFLYKFGTGWTFAGTFPVMEWLTGWIPLSKAGLKVYPKFVEIITTPQDITDITFNAAYDLNIPMAENIRTIQTQPTNLVYVDEVTDFEAWDPFDDIPYDAERLPLFGSGRTMQMNFKNTSDKPVEILDITLQAVAGGF